MKWVRLQRAVVSGGGRTRISTRGRGCCGEVAGAVGEDGGSEDAAGGEGRMSGREVGGVVVSRRSLVSAFGFSHVFVTGN